MRNGIIISISLAGLVAWAGSEGTSNAADGSRLEDSWVTVSGTVAALNESSFELDYDGGLMTVSIAGWKLGDAQRYALMGGGRVLVSAKVGPEFFSDRTVRATSVYLERVGQQLYASGHAHDGFVPTVPIDTPARVELVGRISSVAGWSFIVETTAGPVEIDTRGVAAVHLEEVDFERMVPGDRVRLSGLLEGAVFDRTLRAELITRI